MRATRLVFCVLMIIPFITVAQEQKKKKERKGEFYFSWGYNKEWYTNSNVRVSQPGLHNNYTLSNVQSHDHPGWDEGSLLKIPLSIPQYNYRVGYFFDKEKGLSFEINFDHTKRKYWILIDEPICKNKNADVPEIIKPVYCQKIFAKNRYETYYLFELSSVVPSQGNIQQSVQKDILLHRNKFKNSKKEFFQGIHKNTFSSYIYSGYRPESDAPRGL